MRVCIVNEKRLARVRVNVLNLYFICVRSVREVRRATRGREEGLVCSELPTASGKQIGNTSEEQKQTQSCCGAFLGALRLTPWKETRADQISWNSHDDRL